jgi:hypothetical protein
MAKKKAIPTAKTNDTTSQLIDAIVTVKHLQAFVESHGGLEKAVAEVTKVNGLIKMTGGFDQLKQALEVVGKKDELPPA